MDNNNNYKGIKKFVRDTLVKQLGESPIENSMNIKKDRLKIVLILLLSLSFIGFAVPLTFFALSLNEGNANIFLIIPIIVTALLYGFIELFYKELKSFKVKDTSNNEEV